MKDSPKGKTTMNDVMQQNGLLINPKPFLPKVNLKDDVVNLDSNMGVNHEESVDKVKQYNSTIAENIPNEYLSFQPRNGHVLVRVYRDLTVYKDGNFWVQKEAVKLQNPHKSGQGFKEVNYIPEWRNAAIVISSPSYLTKELPFGTRVQISDIPPAAIDVDGNVFLAYTYKHPDRNNTTDKPTLSTQLGDEDYGYFLIPESLIVGCL